MGIRPLTRPKQTALSGQCQYISFSSNFPYPQCPSTFEASAIFGIFMALFAGWWSEVSSRGCSRDKSCFYSICCSVVCIHLVESVERRWVAKVERWSVWLKG